jgi:aspartyl-tRNA(Asn)/glutamyl-tRNA(Gln) amidotransferase subunit B
VLRMMNERNLDIAAFRRTIAEPAGLAKIIQQIREGLLDTSRARAIVADAVQDHLQLTERVVAEVVRKKGIEKVDESELMELCRELLAANPKIVADVKGGKVQAAANLIGQAKKRNPNVNPARVREILIELIENM